MQDITIVYQKQAMFVGYSVAAIQCLWVIYIPFYIYIYIYLFIYIKYAISHGISFVKGKGKNFTVEQVMKAHMTSGDVAALFL